MEEENILSRALENYFKTYKLIGEIKAEKIIKKIMGEAQENKVEKPPLGLIPEFIHKEQRYKDVCEAIKRYEDANREIPEEWRNERIKLFSEVLEYRNKNLNQRSFTTDQTEEIISLIEKYLKYK